MPGGARHAASGPGSGRWVCRRAGTPCRSGRRPREPAVGRVLRRRDDLSAELLDALERRVDVRRPRSRRSRPGARPRVESSMIPASWPSPSPRSCSGTRRCRSPRGRPSRTPRGRRRRTCRTRRCGARTTPGRRPRRSPRSPCCRFGCHAPTIEPPGSSIIAELPFSATTIGPISTEPPCSGVAFATRSTSSVMRCTPHASG